MKKFILGVGVVSLLFSCKKDDENKDTEKPTLGTVTVNNGTQSSILVVGKESSVSLDSSVTIQVQTNDNEELSQLKVEVHEASDGHEHRPLDTDASPYSFNKVYTLSGKSQTVSSTLWQKGHGKEYEHGDYHIELIALDKEGNQTAKVYTIEIEEDGH